MNRFDFPTQDQQQAKKPGVLDRLFGVLKGVNTAVNEGYKNIAGGALEKLPIVQQIAKAQGQGKSMAAAPFTAEYLSGSAQNFTGKNQTPAQIDERTKILNDELAKGTPHEEAARIAQANVKGKAQADLVMNFINPESGEKKTFDPASFTKWFTRSVANTKNAEEIAPMLRRAGVADDLINSYAEKLAKVSDEKEVQKALDRITEIQKTTAAKKPAITAEAPAKAPEIPKPATPPVAVSQGAQKPAPSVMKNSGWSGPGEIRDTFIRNSPQRKTWASKAVQDFEEAKLTNSEAPTRTPPRRTPQTAGGIEPPASIGSDRTRESLPFIVNNDDLAVKSKVNILDYLRTPDKVLNKVGLGNQAKKIRQGWEGYQKGLKNELSYLSDLAAKVPGQESSKKIFKALDGQPVDLTPAEREVENELRFYLKTWADKLELPKTNRISNYITHIFEQNFVKKEFDPDLAKLISDQVPGSVYDPFVQKRLGKGGYIEDVWRALDAYVKRASRKVNMDPALDSLKGAADALDLETYKYVKRYADQINLRPTEIDSLIDNTIKSMPVGYRLGQRPVATLTRWWRNTIYRGALGLNVGSAVRNLTQGANTYAKLGERYTVSGYFDMFRHWASDGLQELKQVGVLDDSFIQDKHLSLMKKISEKADTALFSLFEAAEKINRGAAYFGAKRKALNSGLSESHAIDYAKKIVRDTQFTFGSIDTPVALGSDLAKTLAQFQSFNVKQTEFLADMVKNKEWAGLVRWLGSSLGLVYTAGRVLGMKPADLIPTVGIGGSPAGTVLSGVKNVLSDSEQKRQEGISSLKRSGAMMVPAGSQIKKLIEGVSTVSQGRSTTASGRTRYKVEQSPSNYLRAGLFGTYSLPESKAYYNKETPKKAAKGNRFNF